MDRTLLVESICYGMMWYFWIGTLVLPAYGDYFSADPILTHGLLLVASVATLAVYCVAAVRGKSFPKGRWPIFAAVTLLVLSVLFNVAGLDRVFSVPGALLLVFCVGFGVGLGLFACSQIEFLGGLKLRDLRLSLLASVSAGLTLLVPMQILLGYDSLVFGVVESLLAYSVVPFLGLDFERVPKRRAFIDGPGSIDVVRPLLKVVPSLISFGLFLGFFVSNLPATGNAIVTTAILVVISMMVVFLVARFSRDASFVAKLVLMAKLVSLLGVVGVVLFLAYPSFEGAWLGVVAASFIAFLLTVMLFCATSLLLCGDIDNRPALAGILFIGTTGVVVGLLIRYVLGGAFDEYFKVACLIAVSILAAASTFLLDKRGLRLDSDVTGVVSSGPAGTVDFTDEEARVYCPAIAAEYSLTAKQAEVLVYLARGRSAKSIAESLGNSEGTIRGHINQIYTKLDVHSKDELTAFLRETINQYRS